MNYKASQNLYTKFNNSSSHSSRNLQYYKDKLNLANALLTEYSLSIIVSCLPNLICLALATAKIQGVLKGSKLFPHYLTAVKFPLQTSTLIDHQLIAHTMEKFHENFKESGKQVFAFRCRGGNN